MAHRGVMLAHNWADSTDPAGWWMSEKLDGVRAYWDGRQLISRNNNVFHAPKWFVEGLPKDHLDGELWIDRGRFAETSGIVRRHDEDAGWREMGYLIFDAPEIPGPFEKRLAWMQKLRSSACAVVPQIRCTGVKHLETYLGLVERAGGEGLILRAPGSAYVRSRSHELLKVKTFVDAEAVVTGYQPGEGKHKGVVGALLCSALGYKSPKVTIKKGTTFKVGTGLTDEQRKHPPKKGSVITFRCQEVTADGVPRFPSFIGARDYE
jgi:DNA ligase-1